jgi:hypothetical protein
MGALDTQTAPEPITVGDYIVTERETATRYLYQGHWGKATRYEWKDTKMGGFYRRGSFSVPHDYMYPWGRFCNDSGMPNIPPPIKRWATDLHF